MNSELRHWTKNASLIRWIQEAVSLCSPSHVHLCDGSEEEYRTLCAELVHKKIFVQLDPRKRPGSFWCHSSASDVARVEEATFICSLKKEDAGPNNNWKDPAQMFLKLQKMFRGCMAGRTLYVIPFLMGSWGSSISRIGVQITDSPYVVCSMHIMTRTGSRVLAELEHQDFVPCLHSLGAPLKPGQKDTDWPCCAEKKCIVHFPEDKSIWSFGSGYGGNALLGKKSMGLRIASLMGKQEGWLAEHMLILSVTNPQGIKKYFAAAFPSQCGKTNLAMLSSAMPGWKVECVGDDIAWIYVGSDGLLRAVNPEAGFFGVAPGTSWETNPNAMQTIAKNTLFTNVALTPELDVWWEGMTPHAPNELTDWKGNSWHSGSPDPAAHPNARFTVAAVQCPCLDEAWDDPLGVPLSGIIFGGRRSSTVPLVRAADNWRMGVLFGASISSETTSAAEGATGRLRHDPFGMLPFCGYNLADYFSHWLQMGQRVDPSKLPAIFYVNWFRKSKDGLWLWPGFKENIRVLKWMFERIEGDDNAVQTPIGWVPSKGSLDTQGPQVSERDMEELLLVDRKSWLEEILSLRNYFATFGERFPEELKDELDRMERKIFAA